jgi:type IV pilus assembly protein PilO
MSPVIEEFFERPLSHKLGALVVALFLLAYLFWQFLYKEPFNQLGDLADKIATLESQIVAEKKLSRELPKLRKEVENLDMKLSRVIKQLPDKKEIPELLSSVSGLAREAGLAVATFRPNPERINDFYAEVPVSVTVEGSYHEIATFFDEVGRMSRIVNIDQIALSAPKIGPERIELKADCAVTTFRFLEEGERIEEGSKEETQKRKRK